MMSRGQLENFFKKERQGYLIILSDSGSQVVSKKRKK